MPSEDWSRTGGGPAARVLGHPYLISSLRFQEPRARALRIQLQLQVPCLSFEPGSRWRWSERQQQERLHQARRPSLEAHREMTNMQVEHALTLASMPRVAVCARLCLTRFRFVVRGHSQVFLALSSRLHCLSEHNNGKKSISTAAQTGTRASDGARIN